MGKGWVGPGFYNVAWVSHARKISWATHVSRHLKLTVTSTVQFMTLPSSPRRRRKSSLSFEVTEGRLIHRVLDVPKFGKGFRGVPKNGSLRWRKGRCGRREEIHKVPDVPKFCQGLPRGPWKWDRGGGWDDPQVLDVPKICQGLPRGP